MKRSILFLLVLSVSLANCNKEKNVELEENDDCVAVVPFYEWQDTNALSLSIDCECLDTAIDLSSPLSAFTQVENVNFSLNCDAERFSQIPTMTTVKSLTSNITNGNVIAFPNLEVYRNTSYTNQPVAYQLTFLPKLREVSLYNAIRFYDVMGNLNLDKLKMTFQSTSEHTITIPSNLHTLRNLTDLTIRDVELAIFTNYENLERLEHLKLSNIGRWVRIPETPNQWLNLKTLEVSDVEIRGNLPDIFENLDSLELIYFSGSNISTTTQTNIAKTPNLKELTLSYCELEDIPNELGNLTTLEKLIITTEQNTVNNPLILPTSIGNLNNLTTIFISLNNNQFPNAVLGLTATLESLGVKDDIGILPPTIGDFEVLKELKLANCGLTTLPSEIQNLADTLEKLYLAGNSFDEATKQQIETWLPNTNIYF